MAQPLAFRSVFVKIVAKCKKMDKLKGTSFLDMLRTSFEQALNKL